MSTTADLGFCTPARCSKCGKVPILAFNITIDDSSTCFCAACSMNIRVCGNCVSYHVDKKQCRVKPPYTWGFTVEKTDWCDSWTQGWDL